MKEIIPTYYRDFRCIGSECRHSCCIGWEIEIDDKTYKFYKNLPGAMGRRLREHIDEGESYSFLLSGGRCPFFNGQGLCDIQRELGEEALCTVCREYPRFAESFPGRIERGLGLSCEEAVRILFSEKGPICFETVSVTTGMTAEPVDETLFCVLLQARDRSICMLQDRRHSLPRRVIALLCYAQEIQQAVNDNHPERIRELTPRVLRSKRAGIQGLRYEHMERFLAVFADLEIMNDDWARVLQTVRGYVDFPKNEKQRYMRQLKRFFYDIQGQEYQYEHFVVYLVYRYFLKAVYDCDVLAKVKLAAASLLMLEEMDFASWRAGGGRFQTQEREENVRLYSEEVEHSQENLQSLAEAFLFEDIFGTKELIRLWEEEAALYENASEGKVF